jgi:PLD-like domain
MVSGAFHGNELIKILGSKAPKSVTVSSAFVHSQGVRMIEATLAPHAKICRCFIGIRNGTSTLQGVKHLLGLGLSVYVVDTGSQRRLFHPKFYTVLLPKAAEVIIGSANLTYGGLGYNIEAGVHLHLDLANDGDKSVLNNLTGPLDALLKNHPSNCYKVKSESHADTLFESGLLEDEASPKVSTAVGIASSGKKPGTTVPLIVLSALQPPKSSANAPTSKLGAGSKTSSGASTASSGLIAGLATFGPLVWIKPRLPKSDLQFPGASGNATGVLRLTQAKFDCGGAIIDQTTYFRNTVFGGLAWSPGPGGKEVAGAQFTLSIAGIIVGNFNLAVSHKAAWESGRDLRKTGGHQWQKCRRQMDSGVPGPQRSLCARRS